MRNFTMWSKGCWLLRKNQWELCHYSLKSEAKIKCFMVLKCKCLLLQKKCKLGKIKSQGVAKTKDWPILENFSTFHGYLWYEFQNCVFSFAQVIVDELQLTWEQQPELLHWEPGEDERDPGSESLEPEQNQGKEKVLVNRFIDFILGTGCLLT